jgi:PIN domain
MATPLLRSPLIAVDTNIPLDLADEKEHALDALDIVRHRLKSGRILVTPTVFQELVFLAEESEAAVDRAQAGRALRGLADWGLELVNLVPVGHGIVERIAAKLQQAGLLPNRGGRERHLIEDAFNTQKNNGIGLEHVFRANATASKNYYTMMQAAQILWILICQGCLQRLYDWARRATEQGLARALWEGLRARRLPPDLPPLGQIRFAPA